MNSENIYIKSAKRTINIEIQAINDLKNRIDDQFSNVCKIFLNCSGKVIVFGLGKSGHICSKIAATLSSTGTPAFFIHPSEAGHGDAGILKEGDIVLMLSNSGETQELLTLIPLLKTMNIKTVCMTGNKESTLAKFANQHIDVSVKQEACPLGLAPTSSTTVALVMGDALATALLEARGFTAKDFAFSHPSGSLGKRLLLKIKDLMHSENKIPMVHLGDFVHHAILEMTSKGLGVTTVVDKDKKLMGLFTDGDIRRAMQSEKHLRNITIEHFMTQDCLQIYYQELAIEALSIMRTNKITSLVCTDNNKTVVGIIHIHDLLKAGIL